MQTSSERKQKLILLLPFGMAMLFAIQPIMDVLSYFFSSETTENYFTLGLRFLVLAVVLVVSLILEEKKRPYLIFAIAAVLLYAGHLWAILHGDTTVSGSEVTGLYGIAQDAANYIRVLQMPLFTMCFISIYRKAPGAYQGSKYGILTALAIIAAVEVLATLTGTDPHTYANKGLGVLGWFGTTNAQSAVLSMSVPLTCALCLKSEEKWQLRFGICFIGFMMLLMFATRLSWIALFLTIFGLILTFLILDRKGRKRTIIFLLCCAVFCAIATPFTPMAKNQKSVAATAEAKQEKIYELTEKGEIIANRHEYEGQEYELTRLKYAYDRYLRAFIDKYGLERIADAYGYTTDETVVCSARLMKLTYCRFMMEDNGISATLFGLELGDLNHAGQSFDPENDFAGIFMLYGAAGAVCMAAWLIWFLFIIAKALIKNSKKYFTLETAGIGIALITCLLHAYATAGVLRRPNSSVYLSAILAGAYYIIYLRDSLGGTASEMALLQSSIAFVRQEPAPAPVMIRRPRKIDAKLPLLIGIICAAQPVMDVMSFWCNELGTGNTITLLLRLAVLAGVVLLGFFLSDKKKIYITGAAACVVLWIGHVFVCWNKGYLDIVGDTTNYIRILQMPYFALSFITFLKRNPDTFEGLKRGFAANFAIITAVVLLSLATGTCRATYDQSGLGIMGWFLTSSAQSAIMSILSPIVVWMACETKKTPLIWLTVIAACAQLYFLGTRLAFFSLAIMVCGLIFVFLVTRTFRWKTVIPLALCLVAAVLCVKVSPMYRNQNIHNEYLDTYQDLVDNRLENGIEEILAEDSASTVDADDEEIVIVRGWSDFTDAEKCQVLDKIYNIYSSDLCDRFGTYSVIRAYDYARTVLTLTNARQIKITFCSLLMDEYPDAARLFGMELERMDFNGASFDVENDFHGVFFLTGAIGLALMLAFLLYFIWMIAKALIRNPKKYFTPAAGAFGISLCIALFYAYNTAGVLRRPNSSFYLSGVLAAVYYLVKIKKYPEENG